MSAPASVKNRVVLICIDGWGIKDEVKGNAIKSAKTPVMTSLTQNHLSAKLDASGLAVGLPKGVMGNSEVGHLTIGAGRVSFQDLVRINASLEDKSFFKNPTLLDAINRAKSKSGKLHLLGLVSDGGVHSHIEHLFAFLKAAKENQVPNTYVHFFADGRDTAPTSGTTYIRQLQQFIQEKNDGYGKIATVTGRYYAMDRDKRWDRIKIAYEGLVKSSGEVTSADALVSAVEARYAKGETDEFLTPIIVEKDGFIGDHDTMIFIDFRSDRMREIAETFGVRRHFETDTVREDLGVYQMTQYDEKFPLPIIFPPQSMKNVLAEWLSVHDLKQFHTAETEKYAHVTFFFAGGREQQFPKEERFLIASPKVPTYDHKPEMSMNEVGESVIKAISSGDYPFIVCNLASPDMVGHTGMFDKAVIAVEACDRVIGNILEACQKHGYVLVITADHGNAEEMIDENGEPKTSHTTNNVPLLIAADKSTGLELARDHGGLCDVAPTILDIMGLPIPEEMTGKSMIRRK